jgi:hypothetical protein
MHDKWKVYKPGDVVRFDGGPWDGESLELSEQDAERVWIPVLVDPDRPAEIQTPRFDAAFGLPTPEPCAGYYRPFVAGDSKWHWFKSPTSLPSVGSLPYIGFYR